MPFKTIILMLVLACSVRGELVFDGVDDVVNIPSLTHIGIATSVGYEKTVSFWAKGDAMISNRRTTIGIGVGKVYTANDGKLYYAVNAKGVYPWTYKVSSTAVPGSDHWNHYAVVIRMPATSDFGSEVADITLIVNGVAEEVELAFSVASARTAFSDIDIGRFQDYIYSTTYYAGSIDDLEIRDYAMTAQEAAALYQASAEAKGVAFDGADLTAGMKALGKIAPDMVNGTNSVMLRTGLDPAGYASGSSVTNSFQSHDQFDHTLTPSGGVVAGSE